jgi:hypothetical protein
LNGRRRSTYRVNEIKDICELTRIDDAEGALGSALDEYIRIR